MELMPGYKRSDVGVIPDDWDAKALGEIGDSLIGLTYRPSEVRKYGTLVLRSSNVQNGTLCFDDNVFVDTDIPERIMVRPGDILVCVRNGSRDLIGKSALIDERAIGMTFGAFMGVFRSEHGKLLHHVFQSSIFKKQINEHLGATINQITNKSLNSFKVPLPPTEEERTEIARALSDVDALLASLDQVIAKKRDLKQAAMQQLLTGEKRLPGFTGEWVLKSFGDLFDFSGGYSASRDQLSNEGHCYLHYGDIHGSSKTSVNTRRDFLDIPKLSISLGRISEGSLLKHGDVVFVDASEDDAGTSKHLVIENEDDVPFISGLHTIVAKSKENDLAHAYKHYCFQTPAIRQQFMFYAVGTKVSGISKTNIAKLTLPIPSIPEQIAIADVLSSMDVELANLEARRDKTRNIKQAIMQELLTGKKRLVEPRGANA
ncbi:restriction endonuclease subunit S [Serratia surfactantfaciens]|uniref:restriction endonuclease subunit S n=1 Tax=Serratia surfactantfaciens TaxID=2741499 RepID=UPI001B3C9E2B|nr:restriction endonuclease subunit S [Serratia surfactantfaciens]